MIEGDKYYFCKISWLSGRWKVVWPKCLQRKAHFIPLVMSSHTSIWVQLIFLPFALLTIHLEGFQKSTGSTHSRDARKGNDVLLSTLVTEALMADTMPVDLATYYKYTNLAARAIYDNHFEQASACYDTAFMHKTYPFYEDLKNFILLNVKSGLSHKNEVPLHQIIVYKQVDTAQVFKALPKRLFSKVELAAINKLVKIQKKSSLPETMYEKSLKEMFVIDQEIRDYDAFSQKDYEARKAIYARRDSVDKENFIRFEKLYNQYGFPGEERMGVFYDADHQWNEVVYILLRHFIQGEDEEIINKVQRIIESAFYAGDLHPSIYATLVELIGNQPDDPRPGYNFMKTTINLVMGEIYRPFVFYTDSLMQAVNTNRIAIGLDSFHIVQKQVVCQYLGMQELGEKKFIKMVQYAQIDELPPGLVKMSCEAANIDYHSYKINTLKIMDKCRCEEKIY